MDPVVIYEETRRDYVAEGSSDEEDGDIYRGPAPRSRSPSPAPSAHSTSSSSSSSSSSSGFAGPIGAITTAVERAIHRWARANWSTSSLSSSDTESSSSSFRTTNKSARTRRRRRRPSLTDAARQSQSELDVAARRRAREERLQIPREFVLYIPPTISPHASPAMIQSSSAAAQSEMITTTRLQDVLDRLTDSSRKPGRAHRPRRRQRLAPGPDSDRPIPPYLLPQQDYMIEGDTAPEVLPGPPSRKGKERENAMFKSPEAVVQASGRAPRAWWLDVASPTWEDMRALGKLLHLHPLTLEDILQQETREKLEIFPKLGYHFIVFRAIKSYEERLPRALLRRPAATVPTAESVVDEVYVYLVVFKDGICTFHFSDLSEHLDRVRNRVQDIDNPVKMSSAWIAHGILDSIVDSFFPILNHVELEARTMVFAEGVEEPNSTTSDLSGSTLVPSTETLSDKPASVQDADKLPTFHEKQSFVKRNLAVAKYQPRFVAPAWTPARVYRRTRRLFRLAVIWVRTRRPTYTKQPPPNPTATNLRRMARARRLVTLLGRVLAAKSEVVARLRKRLLSSTERGALDQDEIEVAMYLGDVQDHILSLQHSLAHYERVLSQSHQTYLQQLRTIVSQGRGSQDKAILALSIVTVGVLPVQTMTGMFSMNVHVPKNDIDGTKYRAFLLVLLGAGLILSGYISLIYYWWRISTRRKRSTSL